MKRVFLAGTTAGTTWRAELIERLLQRGVLPEQIFNPHLPKGVRWTEHMQLEEDCQNDPETIILIFVCPAVVSQAKLDQNPGINKAEMLGPMSMVEIGRFGFAEPERTAVVLDSDSFTAGRRPREVLEGLKTKLRKRHADGAPQSCYETLAEAEDWIVSVLTA